MILLQSLRINRQVFLSVLFFTLLIQTACKQNTNKNSVAESAVETETKAEKLESSISVEDEIEQLNKAILEAPNNAGLYIERAKQKVLAREVDAALKDVRRAISIDSTNALFYEVLGDVHYANASLKKASEAYFKATTINPKLVDPHLKLGENYMVVENYSEAISHLDNALRADVYNAKAYYLKGICFKYMKDTSRAVSSFQTAVEQDAEFYDAYIQLGIIYAAAKNTLAEAYYNNALRIDPFSTEALYNKGLFYQDIEQYEQAITTYRKIIQLKPNYALPFYNIGFIKMIEKEEFDSAAFYFSNAIANSPDYFQAYYNRGLCNELMGYYQQAQSDYKESLKIQADFTPAAQGLNRLVEGNPLKP